MSDDTKSERMAVLSETPARRSTEEEQAADMAEGYYSTVTDGERIVARMGASKRLELSVEMQREIDGEWSSSYNDDASLKLSELEALFNFVMGRDE